MLRKHRSNQSYFSPVKEHNEIYKLLRIKPLKEHTVPADCMP